MAGATYRRAGYGIGIANVPAAWLVACMALKPCIFFAAMATWSQILSQAKSWVAFVHFVAFWL